MNLRSAIVLMMASLGLRQGARNWSTNRLVGHTQNSIQRHGRLHSNQRQKRKDRRRAFAAGNRKAFN